MAIGADFIRKVEEVAPKLKGLFLDFIDEIDARTKIITIERNDFNEMRQALQELAKSQQKLMETQDRSDARIERLIETQDRSDARIERLIASQDRADARIEKLIESQSEMRQSLQELSVSQRKLSEAQALTEKSVKALADSQKTMAAQLGGLSMAVGYGIEDKIMPDLKDFALQKYGIDVTMVDRRNVVYPDGGYDEINLYAEGIRNNQSVFLIGECKAQPGKKDFDRFDKMLRRLQKVLNGDIVPFIVGYHYAPEVETYADLRHPRILRYKTFQISHYGLTVKTR